MKNKTNMFSDWSEVTNEERNKLVFEYLNKSYGAFEIRKNYDKTLLKSFSFILLLTLSVLGLSFFAPAIKQNVIIPDTPAIQTDPPVFQLPQTPPQSPNVSPSASGAKKSNTFSQPVVTTDSILPQDSIQSLALNTTKPSGSPNDSDGTETESPSSSTTNSDSPGISPDSVFYFPDVRPEFPGGDKELMRFLTSNARIPESLTSSGRKINEKLGIVFIVDKDGSIASVSLFKGGCQYNELNMEALRVINKMPKWKPGKQNGNTVKVRMVLPFRFEVKN